MPTTINGVAAVPEPVTPARGITGAGLAATLTRPHMVVIIWLGVIFHSMALIHQLPSRITQFDFSIYYASALALHENLDPYTTDLESLGGGLGLEIDPIHYATDPPTFLLMIEPLALMPLRRAFWAWNGLNLAALIAAVILLLYGSSLDTRLKWALAALALLYAPVGEHFFYAQKKILVLFLLAAMMRCMERRHDAAAGLILGFAGAIRGFPLLLAGYLFMQRRTRALVWTGVGLALCGLVTVALLGVHQTLSFSHGLFFVTRDRFLVIPINISLGAFISRLFWYAYPPTPVGDGTHPASRGCARGVGFADPHCARDAPARTRRRYRLKRLFAVVDDFRTAFAHRVGPLPGDGADSVRSADGCSQSRTRKSSRTLDRGRELRRGRPFHQRPGPFRTASDQRYRHRRRRMLLSVVVDGVRSRVLVRD